MFKINTWMVLHYEELSFYSPYKYWTAWYGVDQKVMMLSTLRGRSIYLSRLDNLFMDAIWLNQDLVYCATSQANRFSRRWEIFFLGERHWVIFPLFPIFQYFLYIFALYIFSLCGEIKVFGLFLYNNFGHWFNWFYQLL